MADRWAHPSSPPLRIYFAVTMANGVALEYRAYGGPGSPAATT
jgi:hypothetical protein